MLRTLVPVPLWMVWNTLLAMVPLALSFGLFSQVRQSRSVAWWIGLGVFLVALPNAPYDLTDVIHLIDDARDGVLIRTVLLYSGFIAVGVAAYTISVARLIVYLRRAGLGVRATVAAELAVHGVVAIGVLIGRYGRWNSWDAGTRPWAVVRDSAAWASPRAFLAVFLLAAGLVAVTATLRLAAVGAKTAWNAMAIP